jgi:hypothetical protein
MTVHSRHRLARTGIALLGSAPVWGLCGCARSPVFNVLGSYFPGWIACMLLGVLIALLVRTLLNRRELEARIAALPLFYLSIALVAACALWLIAFE